MSRLLAIGIATLACVSLGRAQSQELFAFHSAFWMNLHTDLHALVRASAPIAEPLPESATGEERRTWESVIAAYRQRYGKRSLLFDDEMVRATDRIAAAESRASPDNTVFPDSYPVIAKYWSAFLSGEISRGEAIARVLRPAQQPAATLQFSKRQLFVNPYESTAVGDLNRDGHPDIVYGAYWFAGPAFVPRTFRPNHVAREYLHSNSDHVYDVDKDGWPDVIAGGWTEDGIWWFRNPGNSAEERKAPWDMHAAWEARLLSKTRGTMEMFALHDYDNDGVPELHSANYRKNLPLEVWRWTTHADGSPALTPFVLGEEGGGHGYAWGDVNGDGREDVLTEIGWYERPAGDLFARPWKLHPETALPHPSCPFVVKDLNGDGRLDIIFGRGHDVGLYWWEQQKPKPDGTTVWTKHIIDESWTQAHALALADLDGDGDEELVAGKCIWAHNGGDPGAADPPAVYYYKWNRAASAFTRHTIAAPGENIALGRQFDVIDLNGDGRLDLTAPSRLGLWVIFNRGLPPPRSAASPAR